MVLLMSFALLAASQSSAEAPVAAENAKAAAPEVFAADGGPATGKFRITRSDSVVVYEEVRPDGTMVDTVDGEVVFAGRWNQKSPGQFCFTSDEEGAEEECNAERIDENGVWITETPDGDVATIERVVE